MDVKTDHRGSKWTSTRRLPPPLTGDLSCSDPLAQYLTEEGACRELRRGRGPRIGSNTGGGTRSYSSRGWGGPAYRLRRQGQEGPNEGAGSGSATSSGAGGRRVAGPAPGGPL